MSSDDETTGEKLQRLRSRLTKEQRTFCETYLASQDAHAAYVAGYGRENKGHAYTLLGKWYIRDYIQALGDTDMEELLVTREEILSTLRNIMRKEYAEDKDRIRAAEVAAKIKGMHVKKVEHSGAVTASVGLNEKQIQDLRANFLGVDPRRLSKEQSE